MYTSTFCRIFIYYATFNRTVVLGILDGPSRLDFQATKVTKNVGYNRGIRYSRTVKISEVNLEI